MQFQKYEKYKPSNIDWLGEIPEEWEGYRINWINTIIRGNSSFKKDELLENGEYIALQYGKTYKVDEVNKIFNFYVNSEFYKPDQVVHHRNIILVSTSETIEDLGHTCFYNRKDLGLIGGEQILLKPKSKLIFEKYLYYYSKVFCKELRKYSTGLKVFRFNIDDLKKIYIPIPNKQTQITIANYLDKQTSLIDKKIELLKAKKRSYTELKQTLINEVVTKGLDKTVEMKDSGIEWLGQIPKHWVVKRLKDIFNERVEKNCLLNGEPVTSNILSVMKDIGVINHRDKGLVGNKMSEDITGYKLVHVDDIVVNKMNVMIGSVGISKEFGALSLIYIILKAKNSYLSKFYDYLFRIKNFQRYLRKISTGILEIREAVNMILFMGQEIPVPPKPEQIAIANYLDEKTSKIDQIIKKLDKNILALQEFRKTLINDVVTGKVKVL